MKKLYRKGSVHPSPSPSPSPSPTTSDHFLSLSFLPAAILTLSAALSDDDKQLLAYLLSCSSSIDFHPSNKSSNSSSYKKHNNNNNNNNNNKTHQTCFTCYCFTCYTSYWSRWDSSPNRQLIHEIIDAFEDHLLTQRKNKLAANNNNNNNRRYKKKNNAAVVNKSLDDYSLNLKHATDVNAVNNTTATTNNNKFDGSVRDSIESCRVDPVEEGQTEEKQGSVRKMVSFLWETVWG